ncbi:MAG: hypothetical protein ABJQ70_15655 [Roseobacter sp.]
MTTRCGGPPEPLDKATFNALYTTPLAPPDKGLNTYHLGHSLVGHTIPVMLQQLAGEDHRFSSQLGSGTNLRAHWEPDIAIKHFEETNRHPQYRDPHEALASGTYDALIVTETVEIRDSIKYHDSQGYLRKWASTTWSNNPETRVYLYETWHKLDDEEGWLARLDRDLDRYWEGEILRRTLAHDDINQTIYVIPGGQVMAAFARKIDAAGGIGALSSHKDLFSDHIHFNDFGAYLMALTHYAVLYGRSPVGLPYALLQPDGSPAENPGPVLARAMQETVWDVVTNYSPSGVSGD